MPKLHAPLLERLDKLEANASAMANVAAHPVPRARAASPVETVYPELPVSPAQPATLATAQL